MLSLFTFSAFSEDFRVRKVVVVDWENETSEHTVELGMMEALQINFAEQRNFIEAIEMEISLPPSVSEHGPAIAYTFYKDVLPEPSINEIDYAATKVNLDTFTYRQNYHFTIPVSKDYETTVDPYTTNISLPFTDQLNSIFMRLHIIMKGVPDGLYDSSVKVTLKPIFNTKGLLDLNIQYPEKITQNFEKYPYVVFIDEEQIDFNGKDILLEEGSHHLAVTSDYFRSYVQTFDIDRTRTTDIAVQLQDIAPLLQITAPKDTVLHLNNNQFIDFTKPIEIVPGSHTLRFIVGDYEILRTIDVQNGRTYNVSLDFDVTITEE